MWSPGGPPGPAGWDRRRVGARLRAALAGLQELQGLRARQQELVRGALAVQPPPAPAARRPPRAQELRLEAALAALQDQLVRSARGAVAPGAPVQVRAARAGRLSKRLTKGSPLGFGFQVSGTRGPGARGPFRTLEAAETAPRGAGRRRGRIPVGLSFTPPDKDS